MESSFPALLYYYAAQVDGTRDETKTGVRTIVTVETSLIRTCIGGPAVSFDGSSTVSPTTPCGSRSPKAPVCIYIYFLALSQAPPALFRNRAVRMPVVVQNIRKAAMLWAPSKGLPW
eukprot:GHVS01050534.1.p1 GENE.GHVS01050534.1~~GHVS01050534.1.p1  ORF type:complete len:117 (+),score=3.08 GHVS01050534.1:288-638(+)